MKRLIFFVGLMALFSTSAFSQVNITSSANAVTWNKGSYFIDSVFGVPVRDTAIFAPAATLRMKGRMTIRPQDGHLYSYNGVNWERVGGEGSGGGSSDGNNYVTSIAFNNGTRVFTLNRQGLSSLTASIPNQDGSETKVNAGTGVSITGIGTVASPYVINATGGGSADGSETKVTAGTNVTVTGVGTIASPYVVNSSGGGGATTETFTQTIAFDAQNKYSKTTQTGNILLTTAASGNLDNSSYVTVIRPNGLNTIAVDENKFYLRGVVDTSQINIISMYYANSTTRPIATVTLVPKFDTLLTTIGRITDSTSSSLDLAWHPVSRATVYDVYRSPVGAGTFVIDGSTVDTVYVDSGLDDTTTYDYRIVARAFGYVQSTSATFSGRTKSIGATLITQSLQMSVTNDAAGLTDPSGDLDLNVAGADQPFSVGIWVKSANSGANQPIFVKSDATSDMWGLLASGSGVGANIIFVLQGPTGAYLLGSIPNTITDGAWHRIVCTYDGSEIFAGVKMYVDGALQTLTNGSAGSYTGIRTGGTTILGYSFAAPATPYIGKLSNAVIVDRVLTALEVTEDYNAGTILDLTTASFAASIIAYLPLNGDLDDAVGTYDGTANAETYTNDVP